MTRTVTMLHPGAMGAALGACLATAGHAVRWVAHGRGAATRQRAAEAGLETHATLAAALDGTDIVFSVCPPAAARELAAAVAAQGYRGVYVDANAVSPDSARGIAGIVSAGGASYVDGGIIGPPPHAAGTTRLYLSGERAGEVAAGFERSALEAVTLGADPVAASALKTCYAAWTKGSAALLLAVGALSRAAGVEDALREEWDRSLPGLVHRLDDAAGNNAPKAWRFVGEMREIAASFDRHGLPGDFHRAAARTYGALEGFRDAAARPPLDAVLTALLGRGAGGRR